MSPTEHTALEPPLTTSPAFPPPIDEDHLAEQERQFHETLEYCPAGLLVVDDDGKLIFHNARLREMLGYDKGELEAIDTRLFWQDLDQRARIIESLRQRG